MRFLFLLFLCFSLHAEPIEFVVSASPGGPNDTVTRKLAERIEKNTNLQIVVVNKPGAAHVIGYNYVQLTNKPTLFMSTPEIMNHPVISQLDEVFNAGYFTNILFVSEKSGIKNMKQLSELSKTREILFGSGGVGTYSHSAMEKVCKEELKCMSIPYKSGAEGMMALMANQIDAYAVVSYGSTQFLDNPKLVAVGSIILARNNSWFKVFSKNIQQKDIELIANVLKQQDTTFYKHLGLEK